LRAVRHLKQRLEVTNLDENDAGLKADLNALEQSRAITRDVKEWDDEVRIAGDDARTRRRCGTSLRLRRR
jgi:hypothetical protein